MPRIPHRKSRLGCVECKRRHIKCDETRPRCLNCTNVQRTCTYRFVANTPSPATLAANTGPASHSTASSSREASTTPLPITGEDDGNQSLVNMNHLELFNHFISKISHLSATSKIGSSKSQAMMIEAGLSNPYLMHEMLALASLHLSITRPERQSFYRQQAEQLQLRATFLFNSMKLEVTVESCIPMFFFSSFLGMHVLCEIIVYRDNNFNNFLDRFTNYLHLHRGVRAISRPSWPYLRQTDLKPVLEFMSSIPREKEYRGSECNQLNSLVESADLGPSSITACQEAVDDLQWVFDGVKMVDDRSSTVSMIHAWPVLLSPKYAELLRQRKPEALVILAYFAVILHYHRTSWFFSDGGAFLIRSISDYLGPYWGEYLAWPNEVLDASALPTMQSSAR